MFHDLFYDERHKRHGASFLNGIGQGSLVFGASPMPLRRIDLALGVHESFDQIDIFEIYLVHLEVAEMADFLFGLGRLVIIIVSHLVMGHIAGSNSLKSCYICYAVWFMLLEWHIFQSDLILFFIKIDGWNLFFSPGLSILGRLGGDRLIE